MRVNVAGGCGCQLLIAYGAIEWFDNEMDVTSIPTKEYVSGQ
jgi:hypothetical protein